MYPCGRVDRWFGLLLVALGAYLPWIRSHPTVDTALLMYPAGLGSGLEIWGSITLALSVIAAVGIVTGIGGVDTSLFRALVGATAVVLGGHVLVHSPGVTGPFVAGTGAILTVLGGLVLLVSERKPLGELPSWLSSESGDRSVR
ncbi:hypothetical protein AB7C87_00680 [Natrarchaeobius sp. A-rgal3]|uniref:hypothetical protein n=1 Tax=Natrarchaeobius versutus TaxID=1679078 RepID=UPI00350FE639